MTNNTILLAIIGYIGVLMRSIPAKILSFIFNKYSFTISVDSQDVEMYRGACKYLKDLNHKTLNNNVKLEYNFGNTDDEKSYNGINYGEYLIFIDKFTIAEIRRSLDNNNKSIQAKDILTVRIFGLYRNKHKMQLLESITPVNTKDLRVLNNSDGSKAITYIPPKSFDDIFTPATHKILSHVNKWKDNAQFYAEHGLVHKTGILLYGPPGTGKSTMVRALSTYLSYDIEILEITSETKPKDLINTINNLFDRCVVLIEDIDCIPCMEDQDCDVITNGVRVKNDKSLFRTFLQVLDGLNSPNDVIFVCTTNNIDKLDYRILRKGRIDLQIELNDINRKYAMKMCDRYNVSYDILEGINFPVNPSKLQHIIFEELGIYG